MNIFTFLQSEQHISFQRHLAIASVALLIFLTGCSLPKTKPEPVPTKEQKVELLRKEIVETARSKIGVHYKLGGVSPKTGFDCSGLVLWSYLQYGIHLPRTTRDQIKAGEKVKKQDLRPGDLVFFKIIRRRRASLHTGIYAGNNKFVHSPRAGKSVEETNFVSPYWTKRYLTARRILSLEK